MCGRTACTVREGGTGEVEAEARWITCTRRETTGTEPTRRTGHAEPVPYFTRGPSLGQAGVLVLKARCRVSEGHFSDAVPTEVVVLDLDVHVPRSTEPGR